MSLAGAMTALGAITFTGMTNYGFDDLPSGVIPTDSLPAVIPDPGGPGSNEGFRPLDVGLVAGSATFYLDHLLLSQAVGLGRPQARYVGVMAHLDTYLAVIADNWLLSDNLREPLTIVMIRLGRVEVGGVAYYGARIRHRWVLRLT